MIESRAASRHGDGSFSIETIWLGEPQRGEVLIAIKASGVCHTDWDSLRWKRRIVLGHEGAGVVLSIGGGVTTCTPRLPILREWLTLSKSLSRTILLVLLAKASAL